MADKYQHQRQSSFGWKAQSDYVTGATTASASDATWNWLLCEPPEVTFSREIEQRDLLEGQSMVEGAPTIGGKHGGTVTFRGDIRSQAVGFDATSDALTSNPETALLVDFLGASVVGVYDAGDLTGVDADTWTSVGPGTYGEGEMFAWGTSATAVLGFGVVKDYTSPTVTLLADSIGGVTPPGTGPTAGDNAFGFFNVYSSTAQPTYRTFRHVGADVEFDLNLIGASPVSLTITANARKVPTYEMTYKFTSWTYASGSFGGLKDPANFLAVPPILGNNNGRLVIDGLATVDGTADTGTCNVSNVQVTVQIEDTELDCHSALEGVTSVVVAKRTTRATFDVPIEDSDLASNETVWDNRLTAATAFSLTVEVGTTPGALFGLTFPQLRVNAQPSRTVVNDNLIGVSLECAPAPYSADGTGGVAADSAMRLHFG